MSKYEFCLIIKKAQIRVFNNVEMHLGFAENLNKGSLNMINFRVMFNCSKFVCSKKLLDTIFQLLNTIRANDK